MSLTWDRFVLGVDEDLERIREGFLDRILGGVEDEKAPEPPPPSADDPSAFWLPRGSAPEGSRAGLDEGDPVSASASPAPTAEGRAEVSASMLLAATVLEGSRHAARAFRRRKARSGGMPSGPFRLPTLPGRGVD